ncbi:imelysin family protein [Leptospira perolatii]|uniref:imelysin family protein n=1 Tax=Leptospira perolatii TaxID=2023191 RepID=UPI001FAED800|nr:imelysin family protein [Leptospira perolatii]
MPTFRELDQKCSALKDAAASYTATPGDSTKFASLRQSWAEARSILKKAEVFYFGPADIPFSYYTKMDAYEKGESTRPKKANIDGVLSDSVTINASYVRSQGTLKRGFGALEYLLFDNGSGSSNSGDVITANSGNSRRTDYILALAQVIQEDAHSLRNNWEPNGGNFLASYVNGTGMFLSPKEALDTYVTKVGNLVLMIEDTKIGFPAGLSMSSNGATNPNLTESIYSRTAYQDLLDNIKGLRLAYFGNLGDPNAKSLASLVQSQSPQLNDSIQTTLDNLEAQLTTKVNASADLYAEINSNPSGLIKPIWDNTKILRNSTAVELLSVLGTPALPSSTDGD